MHYPIHEIRIALRAAILGIPALAFLCCNTPPKNVFPDAKSDLEQVQGEEHMTLTSAPRVPPPIKRRHATRVIVHVEVKEHVKNLADGVPYIYWTFGDETPGQMMRVREGDLVEVHLNNHPDNQLAHNIDFHSATGPGGGGEATFVAPGHSATFAWRAMAPGLYLYHCVAAPAGLHIANGMYGLILVEPKEGMPKVDREFFIVQGEFYTTGTFGEAGMQEFSMEKALKEQPEYVLFNGKVGALMDTNALKVKVGETVRLYLGNAGPALISSFHIVGEIFDHVYAEGGIIPNQQKVQSTIVPVGGSAMVEFKADVPGDYAMVDHSMFRAFNKGAMGMLKIEGKEDDRIFSGRMWHKVFKPGTSLARAGKAGGTASGGDPLTHGQLMENGRKIFDNTCAACHQANGQGMPGVFPPLAKSDFLMADKERAIRVLMNGLKGRITVNGKTYDGEMPKLPLTDTDIASVLTYVRNSFGNSGDAVTLEQVAKARDASGDRTALRSPSPRQSKASGRPKVVTRAADVD